MLFLSACVSSEKLQKNQYLLYGQTIRGNKAIPSGDLEDLIPQKPNRRLLRLPITPALWFYQIGSRNYNREAVQAELNAKLQEYEALTARNDSTNAFKKEVKRMNRQITRLRRKAEEGNWVMRVLGEPPAYFVEADAKENAEKMQRYLFNKGFFLGKAGYSIDSSTTLGRRVRVTYTITENIPFHLRNITYQIGDPRVDTLVRKTLNRSVLKTGERYDADKINNERVRIEELMRNNGYYGFTRQYIPLPLDVDSTASFGPDSTYRNLDMWLRIANPPGQSGHPLYTIGEVEVRVARTEDRAFVDTVMYNGLRFQLGRQPYSMRLLDSRIFLRPDSLYRIRNFQDTQRQLYLLNQFRFANINFTDTTGRRLRTRINLVPIDKYEVSAEGGLFVLYQGQGGYPGPFTNFTFRVHNIFGGLGTFETALRYGFEAQTGFTSNSRVYLAQEFGLNSSVIFPHILFPGKIRFKFNRLSPRTQISVGYNFTDRPDYRRRNFRSGVSYNWLKNTNQYAFTIADINFLRASIKDREFERFLNEQDSLGNTIRNSFRNAFASNIGFSYTYNTSVLGQNRRANFLRVAVESGGTTLNFFREENLKKFFNSDSPNGLQFYKYLRANVDYRHYIPLRANSTLAFRVNTGLVIGYGPNKTAPYEKLFFAGGSNSIRAWLPRRLGPGASLPLTNPEDIKVPVFNPNRPGQFLYRFEQPGDILLEASAELRGRLFHLGGDINGAVFVDAGNVWALRNNVNRINENFAFNTFAGQIAVGAGVGLRIDFSFFIIRFDGAVKVYDPARRYLKVGNDGSAEYVDERFFLPQFRFDKMFRGPNPLVINFGIGYPF